MPKFLSLDQSAPIFTLLFAFPKFLAQLALNDTLLDIGLSSMPIVL